MSAIIGMKLFSHLLKLLHLMTESAFAPFVGFGVLMTSNLGTNALYLRFATTTSLMKDAKVRLKKKG